MQDRQQRALIYNQCAPPHPDPSSHRTARPSITFPRRAARNPKPPRAAQPESRTQDLLAPRNQNPEPKTSSRRATRTQTVPDSSRSAAACRYSIPPLGLEFLRERSGVAFLGSAHGRHRQHAPLSNSLPVPMLVHRILSI